MTYLIPQSVISFMCLRLNELKLQLELFKKMSKNTFVGLLKSRMA